MCRIAAYIGPAAPLSSLLYDPPHSLERQAYQPRELIDGTVNVDGTGVAWWSEDAPEPLRYVTAESPWADPNLQQLSRRIASRSILAAVRSATPGFAIGSDHVSPFTHGVLAGTHNGRIGGFRGPAGRAMVAQLPDEQWSDLGVLNDSKTLFLTVVARYDGDLPRAVSGALAATRRTLDDHDAAATLNLVVSNGTEIVAVRHSVRAPVNSLYVASRADAHLISSEPLDEGTEWKKIPAHHLVRVTADSISTSPLE